MGKVLPAYLSEFATERVERLGVRIIPKVTVEKSRLSEDGKQVELLLSDGQEVSTVVTTPSE